MVPLAPGTLSLQGARFAEFPPSVVPRSDRERRWRSDDRFPFRSAPWVPTLYRALRLDLASPRVRERLVTSRLALHHPQAPLSADPSPFKVHARSGTKAPGLTGRLGWSPRAHLQLKVSVPPAGSCRRALARRPCFRSDRSRRPCCAAPGLPGGAPPDSPSHHVTSTRRTD